MAGVLSVPVRYRTDNCHDACLWIRAPFGKKAGTGVDGEAAAYAQFITALCQMASEQTRILDKPYDSDNDRFAMRIFMVRLGMKGAAFALARKLMMKHLTGNSGWRYGAPPKGKAETAEKEEVNVCD